MKHTTFRWAWGSRDPMNDPVMTRERAAALLRSWRKMAKADLSRFHLRRLGRGVYQVETADNCGTMYIKVDS